jgi:hypothetical protein
MARQRVWLQGSTDICPAGGHAAFLVITVTLAGLVAEAIIGWAPWFEPAKAPAERNIALRMIDVVSVFMALLHSGERWLPEFGFV